MSRLTRDGTAEAVSRDQILRHARGQGDIHFPCSADHEQDWQPYPVDPYCAICDDHTYIHIAGRRQIKTCTNMWKKFHRLFTCHAYGPFEFYSPEGGCSEGLYAFRFFFYTLFCRLGRLLWERKTYTKMDQIRFFVFFYLMGTRMVQIRIAKSV